MNDKKQDLDKFFEHLYTPDEKETIDDIHAELSDNGIDAKRVVNRVEALIKQSMANKVPAWADRARKKHEAIEEKFNEQKSRLQKKYRSAKELVAAIQSGEFGSQYQSRANAFFRNQNFKSLSDKDLQSFIEDCELLSSLAKDGENE